MFTALMKVQWKWTRIAILAATIIGFAIPVGSVRLMLFGGEALSRITAGTVVNAMQDAGILYSILAAAIGLAVAFIAWSADQKGRHVYALSLPVSRARFAIMRFGAGSLFLLIPAAGVLIGCGVALSVIDLPAGLHAYPFSLTLRFLLASFVAYAMFFAVAAASTRAAAMLLLGILGFFMLAIIITAMGFEYDIVGNTMRLLFAEPGVLSVFTGRWMLIDV
jgi:hypothetical protein